jgi:ribulose-phosphate 3-epimerase
MRMANAVQIAPSLLACDMSRFGEELRSVEKAGADLIHLDIMDGHFVPNITIGFPVIEHLRPLTQLPFDAHLMIDDADRYLEEFSRVGCNWLSVHIEACPHVNRTLNRIRELGMKAGIAINPGTSLCVLEAALADADYALIMSVNPGFGGQRFIPSACHRIRELKRMMGERQIPIQVDGGIKEDNIGKVAAAGAEIIVVGTGIFATADYRATITKLRSAGDRGEVSV